MLAGGTVEPDATSFQIAAEAGSDTYGICSNQFLDREFKTVRYELTLTVHDQDSFTYTEDTQLRMKGRSDQFHHTDTNRVTRVRYVFVRLSMVKPRCGIGSLPARAGIVNERGAGA